MLTQKDIINIAMTQSALESGCTANDFLRDENVIVQSVANEGKRCYLELPFICDLTSYGRNIVASVSDELMTEVSQYINRYKPEHCFETPNLHTFIDLLKPYGVNVCFMASYYLPDMSRLYPRQCGYELRLLTPESFSELYVPEWSNALCSSRKQYDRLAYAAYDGNKLIGLAGCSADCKTMWQIGIDVLPEYRQQGIASALTSSLACELLKMDIVPFYCCAWSNVKSAGNAVKSGFMPAWVQLTVKKSDFIEQMNK